MPIEKIENNLKGTLCECPPDNRQLKEKINELIDFINTREQDRSEQMGRMIDRVNKLETQMCRCIDYLNDQENRLKELENATHPKEEESELLKCPFCGEDGFIQFHEIATFPYQPKCTEEGCVDFNYSFKTKQEAISAWNTRHDK